MTATPYNPLQTLYYDADCALCRASVRLVVSQDQAGAIRLFPLASAEGRTILISLGLPEDFRDSIVLDGPGGPVQKAAALAGVLDAMGGWGRLLAAAVRRWQGLADRAYGLLARYRLIFHKFFQWVERMSGDAR